MKAFCVSYSSMITFKHTLGLVFALAIFTVQLSFAKGEESLLRLSFRHVVDGRPLSLDSLRYTNAKDETYSITRLSYLLSGFALETTDGEIVNLPDQFAWIDSEKRRTSFTLTNIPSGKYRSVRFFVGLDTAVNHGETASFSADHTLNPNLNGLHWSWQGGYIFMAIEGKFQIANQELSGFSYHLARDPNRTSISIAANLDLSQPLTFEIDFDIATLLNAPRRISFSSDGNSTHSLEGDPIAEALVRNLPRAFRLHRLISDTPEILQASSVKPLYLPSEYSVYPLTFSRLFPVPNLPLDNPLLQERVNLGAKLFNEKALSKDNSISCSSCHIQSNALTDTNRFSLGIDGQLGTRNAMPLFNLAWKTSFFWDGRAPTLRHQALIPIEDPTEMGEQLENIVEKLAGMDGYPEAFLKAFGSTAITPERIGLAIENFLLTQISYRSKFDKVVSGKDQFTKSEQRGFELFMTEYEPRSQRFGADCFHCHGGTLFSDHQFHNNGISVIDAVDAGRMVVTEKESDRGKFSTPSLRNVAVTAPYMHDGRFQTLEEVVAHYNSGLIRSPTVDANLAKHPISGLGLSKKDLGSLVDFLETLTDEIYIDSGTEEDRPE